MWTNDKPQQLLLKLADGAWHSGDSLAQGIDGAPSRMTVNNYARQLIDVGYPIERKHGAGYRLQSDFDLLDAERLSSALELPVVVVASTASTNDLAKEWLEAESSETAAMFVAGHQTQGRGRMGRKWQAKPLDALLCSLAWRFERYPPDLPALSLVVGLSLIEALKSYVDGLSIKWPNDILLNSKKLAGVLIEASIRHEQVSVVVGFGINMRAAPSQDVRYPATSLAEAAPVAEQLLTEVATRLQQNLPEFALSGFAPFRERYIQYDAVLGRTIELDGQPVTIADIDATGALLVNSAKATTRYVSGELSLPWPS